MAAVNKCIKNVGGVFCRCCNSSTIKHGLVNGRQRYRCKSCNATQMGIYIYRACKQGVSNYIAWPLLVLSPTNRAMGNLQILITSKGVVGDNTNKGEGLTTDQPRNGIVIYNGGGTTPSATLTEKAVQQILKYNKP